MAVVFVFLPFFVHGLALVWPEREAPADALLRGRLPILYRPEYNIRAGGIEKMHPFDSCKYGRVFDGLVEGGFLRAEEAVAPPMITMSELRRVHADSYLVKLGYALALSRALEVPVCFLPGCILRWRVLRPMLFASKGSLRAWPLPPSCLSFRPCLPSHSRLTPPSVSVHAVATQWPWTQPCDTGGR